MPRRAHTFARRWLRPLMWVFILVGAYPIFDLVVGIGFQWFGVPLITVRQTDRQVHQGYAVVKIGDHAVRMGGERMLDCETVFRSHGWSVFEFSQVETMKYQVLYDRLGDGLWVPIGKRYDDAIDFAARGRHLFLPYRLNERILTDRLTLVVPGSFAAVALWMLAARLHRRDPGCTRCGYPHVPGQPACPECGGPYRLQLAPRSPQEPRLVWHASRSGVRCNDILDRC